MCQCVFRVQDVHRSIQLWGIHQLDFSFAALKATCILSQILIRQPKKIIQLGVVAYALIPAPGKQEQSDVCEFEASLVCIVSSCLQKKGGGNSVMVGRCLPSLSAAVLPSPVGKRAQTYLGVL